MKSTQLKLICDL